MIIVLFRCIVLILCLRFMYGFDSVMMRMMLLWTRIERNT